MNEDYSGLNELAGALAKAQGMMQNAVMDKTNPHFRTKYATLASVLDAIRVPLSSNGLAVSHVTRFDSGEMWLETVLIHAPSGQSLVAMWPLPMGGRAQEMGSALTYAKRYTLEALVCNSHDEDDDDDDGNAAQNAKDSGALILDSYITPAQHAEISELMMDAGLTDEMAQRWCLKLGAQNVATLPAAKFEQLRQALIERVAKKAAEIEQVRQQAPIERIAKKNAENSE